MTVIAWDGKTLAADKRALNNGRATTVTKICKHEGWLLAVSGDLTRGLELVKWFKAGQDPEKLPAFQLTLADYVPLLAINKDGVYLFEMGHMPFKIEEPFFACGSGRDCALTAMHLGRDAVQAVQITCEVLTNCGNGIDTLTL